MATHVDVPAVLAGRVLEGLRDAAEEIKEDEIRRAVARFESELRKRIAGVAFEIHRRVSIEARGDHLVITCHLEGPTDGAAPR